MFQMQEADSTSPDTATSGRDGGEGGQRGGSGEAEAKKVMSNEQRRIVERAESSFEREIRQFRVSTTSHIREGENRMAEMTDRQIAGHMMELFVSECMASYEESEAKRKRDKRNKSYRTMVTSTVEGDGKGNQ